MIKWRLCIRLRIGIICVNGFRNILIVNFTDTGATLSSKLFTASMLQILRSTDKPVPLDLALSSKSSSGLWAKLKYRYDYSQFRNLFTFFIILIYLGLTYEIVVISIISLCSCLSWLSVIISTFKTFTLSVETASTHIRSSLIISTGFLLKSWSHIESELRKTLSMFALR